VVWPVREESSVSPAFRFLANIHGTHDKVTPFNQLHAADIYVFRVLIDISMQL
jgi:hypothetical protein